MFWIEDELFYKNQLTDLCFWYPILKDLWVPTPETHIIKHSLNLFWLLENKDVPWIDKLINDIDYYAQKVWYPCFLRTWQSSNKHSWGDSCFLTKKEDIKNHLRNLQEFSYMADMRKARSMETIVIRKMIETKEIFKCFNKMPITREVRLFIKDWKLLSIHPYRPKDAFEWRVEDIDTKMEELNNFSDGDLMLFQKIWEFLAVKFQWYWSVDFLQQINWEWICIDMAVWDNSYKNEETLHL